MLNINSKDYAFGYLKGKLAQTISMISLIEGVRQNRYTTDGVWDRLKENRDYLDKKLDEIEQQEKNNE